MTRYLRRSALIDQAEPVHRQDSIHIPVCRRGLPTGEAGGLSVLAQSRDVTWPDGAGSQSLSQADFVPSRSNTIGPTDGPFQRRDNAALHSFRGRFRSSYTNVEACDRPHHRGSHGAGGSSRDSAVGGDSQIVTDFMPGTGELRVNGTLEMSALQNYPYLIDNQSDVMPAVVSNIICTRGITERTSLSIWGQGITARGVCVLVHRWLQ